jgi:acetyltransferase-like isoleucine patch superfamily enzyme
MRRDTVRIGSNTNLHMGFWLDCGGDQTATGFLEIGDNCLLQPYATLNASGAGIRIGNDVICGPWSVFFAGNHVFSDPNRLIREQGRHT